MSQQALALRVGISRQAIVAIEAGRQVPGTGVALGLAAALGCRVEDLFALQPSHDLVARLAAPLASADARVALGSVQGRWVAPPLPPDGRLCADALATASGGGEARIRPLVGPGALQHNVLIAGCAPPLHALSARIGARFADARLTWLYAGSTRSIELLEAGLVHAAGVHLGADGGTTHHASLARERLPGQRVLLVNLIRWRQGLIVPPGNPRGLHAASDLLQPDLRVAQRGIGSGAQLLLARRLAAHGAGAPPRGPLARDHADVAALVRCGAADVGVAIESVAVAAGLGFVPLSEERFDLVLPAAYASATPIRRTLEAIDDPGFRANLSHSPGYDATVTGHVTTIEAA